MGSVQTTAPATQSVTLADMKDHLREGSTINDDYITELTKVAEQHVEHIARRALIRQTRRADFPCFPDNGAGREIVLDMPPLVSVSGVTYTASDGTTSSSLATTVYDVDTSSEPGRVLLAYGQSWPATQDDTFNAVQVTYVTGYATGSSAVPSNYKHAVKMLVDRWYDDRSDIKFGTIVQDIPHGVMDLIRPTRNFRFV